jgi:hypothetical protein
MDQYYIKKGRRYVPVKQFTGFPADGFWVVSNAGSHSQMIMRLSPLFLDVQPLIKKLSNKIALKSVIEDYFANFKIDDLSINEVADQMAGFIIKRLAYISPSEL